ncbi:MAG: lamin tail domain-containing protein, partial [Bacilli bacterium]
PKNLSSIAVTTQPTNKTYYNGDSFNPAGMVITATYSDSSIANVTSSCTYTPDPLTTGTTSVTATYSEGGVTKTATITGITVNDNSVQSISIKTAASSTTFTLGSTFSSSGLVITALYANSSTADFSTGFTVSGVDTGILGQQTATVTYESKTTSYNVTVTNNGASVGSASAPASDLFISEYIEGASYNKAIEIYNGTGASVSLANYSLKLYSNGSSSASQTLDLSGTLANNDVYVLAHGSAAAEILAVADTTNQTVINYNGDDSVALFKGTTLIDLFGDVTTGSDPGSSWTITDYNNVSATTIDKTFVRHSSISGPSATSPFIGSQWVTYSVGTHSYLGSHTFAGGVSGDVTAEEQAIAWATYFLNSTASTCEAMSGAFNSYWSTLSAEYGYMANSSKDAFCDNPSSNATINSAMARYSYIVQKYAISDFVVDGDGNGLATSYVSPLASKVNFDYEIITIILIIGLAFGFAIVLTSKKKFN